MAESNINNGAFEGDQTASSTWQTFNEAKQDFNYLESTKATVEEAIAAANGVIWKATLAEVNAIDPLVVDRAYGVYDDGANNGYYYWDGVSATVTFNRDLGVEKTDDINDTSGKVITAEAAKKEIAVPNAKINGLFEGRYDFYSDFDGTEFIQLEQDYILDNLGDFVEFTSAYTEGFPFTDTIGVVGVRATSTDVFGYVSSNQIWLRETGSNLAYVKWTGLQDLTPFTKIKLEVVSGGWELFLNNVSQGIKTKTSSLTIDNVGNGYIPVSGSSIFKMKDINIFSSTNGSFTSQNLSALNENLKSVVTEQEQQEITDCYLSYESTGTDAANITHFGKLTIFIKRSEGVYVGVEVVHEVDDSDEKWVDYWRISFAKDYSFDGVTMTETSSHTLAFGESECVFKRQNTPNPKADFSGGVHGDEILQNVKFLVDGKELVLSSDFDLLPCDVFEYQIYSSITEVADVIDGVVTPIVGHPEDCKHFKRTTFKANEYFTYNRLEWSRAVPIQLWYHGISCIGKEQATSGFDDRLTEATFTDQDNTYPIDDIGTRQINYKNSTTGKSSVVTSRLIQPSDKDGVCDLRVQDRFYDAKYYRKYQEDVTVSSGDIWESEMRVTFE